jgi:type IV pilus assembly protein PilQ
VVAPAPVLPPVPTPVEAVAPPVAPAPAASLPAAAPVEAPVVVNPNARKTHDFQAEEVGTVLRILARQAGINIMVSDQITGTINMRVENLTPMEAIRVVVDAKGLDMSQVNNVYFIKTAAEKAKEPTESGCYTFSYAAVASTKTGADSKGEMIENEKLKALIASQIQSAVPPQFDARTNTVFYRDYKSNMSNLALFLDSIDRPTQQVMIEARLVEVNANPKQSYGINWAGTLGGSQSPQTVRLGGSGLPGLTFLNGVPSVSSAPSVALTGDLNNIILNGRGSDIFNQIAGQFAILSVPQMTASLRLLNEDSDTEFLANPRIVTANNLKADIKITRKQPIPKLEFNAQTATSVFSGFDDKEYGNTLSVTPTINKDNFVTMLVKPEISNKVGDASFLPPGGSQPMLSPIIDTRSLESNVLIKSGDTLAIGGLLQDEVSKNRNKVPVLGDIPILGYLFQEHVNARSKRNLLVFITPTIIRQGYGTGLEDQVSGLKHSGEEYADPNGWRNNARGAIRIVPTSNRQVVADYPKPGAAPAPVKAAAPKAAPKFKVTVPDREQ